MKRLFRPFIRYFLSLSIGQKLMLMMIAVSTLTLLAVSGILLTRDVGELNRLMVQELETIARITGDRSTAALIYDDPRVAEDNLAAFAAKPSITLACIYDLNGKVFAYYRNQEEETPELENGGCPSPQESGNYQESSALHLYQQILLAGEPIGKLYIRSDAREINATIMRYVMYMGIFIVIGVLLTWLLSARLQRIISRPIFHLVETARHVSEEKDYSVRAKKISEDEIGILIDSFNTMLKHIQERDTELVRSMEAAEAASRAKSQFLANINHELRTPLNAIIGFSEIIKNEMLGRLENPKYRSYIRDIYDAGRHLLQVINDILDYSKMESGEVSLNLAEVDAVRTVKAAVRLMIPRAEEAGLTIEREDPGIALPLTTDEQRLRQVMLNLLSNAVKFTPKGGTIYVSVGEDRGQIVISVRDTGIGISPEDMEKAMTPFGQVESDLNRHYEGTGLGLPLSEKFVLALGGEFYLDSAVGEGTCVTIVLPRFPAHVGLG